MTQKRGAPIETFLNEREGESAAPDADEGATKISHHFVEEAIADKFQCPGILRVHGPAPGAGKKPGLIQGAYGGMALRSGALESGEIMLPGQLRQCFPNQIQIGLIRHMPAE